MRQVTAALIVAVGLGMAAWGAEQGLVAHYPVEKGSGATLADKSGNGNDGEIVGAKWVKGDFGTALAFDGDGDVVKCGAKPILDSEAGTVMVWVLPTEVGGGIVNRSSGTGWGDQRVVLAYNTYGENRHLLFAVADGKLNTTLRTDPPAVNAWTHLACTYDGKIVTLYVNGKRLKTGAQRTPCDAKGVPLEIGCCTGLGKRWFKGLIDEVRMYNRALSAKEIADLHKSGKKTHPAK